MRTAFIALLDDTRDDRAACESPKHVLAEFARALLQEQFEIEVTVVVGIRVVA